MKGWNPIILDLQNWGWRISIFLFLQKTPWCMAPLLNLNSCSLNYKWVSISITHTWFLFKNTILAKIVSFNNLHVFICCYKYRRESVLYFSAIKCESGIGKLLNTFKFMLVSSLTTETNWQCGLKKVAALMGQKLKHVLPFSLQTNGLNKIVLTALTCTAHCGVTV